MNYKVPVTTTHSWRAFCCGLSKEAQCLGISSGFEDGILNMKACKRRLGRGDGRRLRCPPTGISVWSKKNKDFTALGAFLHCHLLPHSAVCDVMDSPGSWAVLDDNVETNNASGIFVEKILSLH